MRTPTVIVDREVEGVEADRVQIDHEMGAYLATRHLLELGPSRHRLHRRAAVDQRSRRCGSRATGGRWPRPAWRCARSGCWKASSAAPAATTRRSRLLGGEGERPTAIVAGNDMIGIGVLRAAAEAEYQGAARTVGDRLRRYRAEPLRVPALTTVGQSIRLLGEIAAQLLLQRIAEREEPMQRRVVAPALVLRESTAPPLVRV
ncbi:substrate-binding domain-containing protein [Pseudomonas aeruginosa]|nr:substrate-binding domain-containing protein [Pseudomonas aeruginosa]